MTEAETLVSYIEIDHAPGWAVVRRLGNLREWVVFIRCRCYFIWGIDDWLAFRQEEENRGIAKMRERQEAREPAMID